MSLKRRNLIAWMLLLLAALGWTSGKNLLRPLPGEPASTTMTGTTAEPWNTEAGITSPTTESAADWETIPAYGSPQIQEPTKGRKAAGYLLCFAAAALAAVAIFFLRQKAPVFGPDGAVLVLALVGFLLIWVNAAYLYPGIYLPYLAWIVLLTAIILGMVRELWGWAGARFSLSWCAVSRIAGRCGAPRLAMLVFAADITLTAAAAFLLTFVYGRHVWFSVVCVAAAGALAVCCLWQYGTRLGHLQRQLDNFRLGLPIAVGTGPFSGTEEQLRQIQTRHEEAIRTAVTSERFKVELISNVSHDLRTPLTAILGYSELLQKETLSPEGREQLSRLRQKAGYMNDLVESLFELTKVSSGVMEAKKEEIDLIRLLEQTVGLFDDQLTNAGLFVRRNYDSDAIPIITDGARMHQVFANLLGNAIKYALTGTRIYLEVKEAGDSYRIRMMNTSSYEMDFKPEEIMQRFARGDKARSTKGSGLGLAIAQTYTESVGGRFRVSVDGDQFSAIVELPKAERKM